MAHTRLGFKEWCTDPLSSTTKRRSPWNKGKLTGQKAPLRLKDVWAIRVRLQLDVVEPVGGLFPVARDERHRGALVQQRDGGRDLRRPDAELGSDALLDRRQ